MNMTVALLVLDHRRIEFRRRIADRNFQGVTITSEPSGGGQAFGAGNFPGSAFVSVPGPRSFLDSGGTEADAFVWSAESGSAWTLLYPEFSVILVRPLFRVPIGYPVDQKDDVFAEFLSNWLALTEAGPLDERLYDHWISGKTISQQEPRWSIIRDVLHWVK